MDQFQNSLDQEIIEVIGTMDSGEETVSNSPSEEDETVQATVDLAPTFVFGESKNENQEEKTGNPEQPTQQSQPTQPPKSECNVCYKELNIDNVVNTTCKHKYCKKCFFRWMKSSSTCPMCRKNLVSQSVWYENNDPSDELDNLTLLNENIQMQLMDTINKCHENRIDYLDLIHRNKKLLVVNDEQMRRKISLNEDINYARGYLKALNGDNSENIDKKIKTYSQSYKNCPFIKGYYAGYYNRRHMCPNKFRKSFTTSEPSSDDEIMEDAESVLL